MQKNEYLYKKVLTKAFFCATNTSVKKEQLMKTTFNNLKTRVSMARQKQKLTLNEREWHRTQFYEWRLCHSFFYMG